MRKLLELKDGKLIASGSFRNLPKGQEALWRDSENFLFNDSAAEKMPGWEVYKTKASPIYAIEQAYVNGERRSYYATQTGVYKEAYGAEITLGTGFGGQGYWSMTPWGGWLLATNDYDPPKVWKNTGALVNLTGVPVSRFRLLSKWKNHVLGFLGNTLYFSSESDAETWAPSRENSAGDITLRDLDGDVMAAVNLGGALAIYSHDTLSMLQYLGAPYYFGVPSTPLNGVGAVSTTSVIPARNRNYGMSRKGLFVTDGVSYEAIGSPAVNRWLQSNLDWDNARRVVGMHWEKLELVCWWFPCKDGIIRGLAFGYNDNTWSPLTMPVTAAAEQQVFEYPLIGVGNTMSLFGKGLDAGGAALDASLETFPSDVGDAERYKVWDMLRVEKEVVGAAEFRLGYSDTLDETPEWTDWATLEQENWINGRQSVYVTLGIRSNGTGKSVRVGALSLHGEMGGYR